METYSGISVMKGIAVGRIFLYRKVRYQVADHKVPDPAAELVRFLAAAEQARCRLLQQYEEALLRVGEEQARIFDVHRMLLEDEDYLSAVRARIEEGYNAVYAVDSAGTQFAQRFAAMDDEYMRERAADIRDISRRVICALLSLPEEGIPSEGPVILVAEDLSPGDTVKLDKSRILAFVTVKGSANSHTAILARSMNLPAIVGADLPLSDEMQGKMCVVDGLAGECIVEPEGAALSRILAKKEQWIADLEELNQLKGQENQTKSGKKIDIHANIGSVEEADAALSADAGGIGLFRSEFLYLEGRRFPTEEEQFVCYRAVLEKLAGKRVVIRTLDVGADKQADYFHLEAEENPALGYRAIRICLDQEEIFVTQLRALYRAAAYGRLAVMFPMLTSVEEIRRIKEIIERVREALKEEGEPIGEVELGAMIETPAAALISDKLAREVDFFSIGTNDLIQYTLAADRQNQKLIGLYDRHHEAVLRLIEMTVKNAHEAGIRVGICGELAADTELTAWFLSLGVDELSVSPISLLGLRRAVRELP